MFARTFQKLGQRATQITTRKFGSHHAAPETPVLGMEKVDFNKSTKSFLPGDHLHEAPVSWSFNRPVAGGSVHTGWDIHYETNVSQQPTRLFDPVAPNLIVGLGSGIAASYYWFLDNECSVRGAVKRLPEDRKRVVAQWYLALVNARGHILDDGGEYEAFVNKKLSY
jgi:hypothetical protein